jgi:hypothetical protein
MRRGDRPSEWDKQKPSFLTGSRSEVVEMHAAGFLKKIAKRVFFPSILVRNLPITPVVEFIGCPKTRPNTLPSR